MASLNQVHIIGYLGKDPDLRYMQNGDAVCNITVATSETWKDKATGEKREATEWHRIVIYRKLAEIAGKYLKKGGLVYVGGALKTRKWKDRDAIERYTTEIIADEMRMLSGRGDRASTPAPAESSTPPAAPATGSGFDDMEDDIPF